MGCLTFLALSFLSGAPLQATAQPRNVVLITLDGVRPTEVFTGAQPELMDRDSGGVENPEGCRARFGADTAQARREALMPFLWRTMAREGQVFGNAALGAPMRVTNGRGFSYPGYNELLTGAADPRIDSNGHPPNDNVTVFEWLATLGPFRGRVQAFATWDAFFRIFNVGRSKLDVRAGWEPPFANDAHRTPTRDALDALFRTTTPVFGDNALDSLTYAALKESLRTQHPRVLFLGLGEHDEWMHAGRYDLALEAAHREDALVQDLWNTLQAMPAYRGTTTFLLTTDHGRGAENWKEHGASQPGSEDVWFAAMGPGVPALGERSHTGPLTQAQVASTVAGLLGEDWRAKSPAAAAPLPLQRVQAITSAH
jgi:hypothetical protein